MYKTRKKKVSESAIHIRSRTIRKSVEGAIMPPPGLISVKGIKQTNYLRHNVSSHVAIINEWTMHVDPGVIAGLNRI